MIIAGNTGFDVNDFFSPLVTGNNLIGKNIFSQSNFPAGTPNVRLGHSSLRTTLDTYSRVLPEIERISSDKLEALLYRKTG